MKTLSILVTLLCCNLAWGQHEVRIDRVILPEEIRQELVVPTTDPDIENLQWNRWTSESFVVCSINDNQAKYLVENLENIKKWVYERWGFPNAKFVTECRIICVDDPVLYEKCFGINESMAEVRYNDQNEPELMVIFFLLNQTPSATIPSPLTELCLANLDETYDIETPPWILKGIGKLNGTLPSIRLGFSDIDLRLQQDAAMYFSRILIETTSEQYKDMDESERSLYNNNAMALCLFLRKEYGQIRFHHFYWHCAKGGKADEGLSKIYGFQNCEHLDQNFKMFMVEICNGIKDESITNSDLQVNKSDD